MKFHVKLLLTLCISFAFSAQWVGINSNEPVEMEKTVLFSDIENTTVEFNLDGFWVNTVQIDGKEFSVVQVDGGSVMLEAGTPDLQKLTASLIIPDEAHMLSEVVSSEYVEFENYNLAPSKGNFTRDIMPEDVPYTFGSSYQTNAFFPGSLTDLGSAYVIRDFRGQPVHVYPFQFNPVTGVLRVYTQIVIDVHTAEGIADNPKIRTEPLEVMDSNFKDIYARHFDNFNLSRYNILEEQGNMIVICYDGFLDEIQPFVDWKKIKGQPIELFAVSEAGGSSSNIANFIEDYYYETGLTFVLLVGDIAQIPSPTVGGSASDPSYGFIEGNDSYHEVMIGRFSAENANHVQTQVERSVNYERYPEMDGSWYHKGIGLASSQGSGIGDEGESDFQHEDNIRDLLMGYGYTVVDQIYDTNGGSASDVTNGLNEGRSIINYTGHGSMTAWSTTGFSNSHVNNLTNDNMLPFIVSVACVNGQFQSGTCFAEAWLRATNGDQPTGAIATLMSTVNQSWAPPMQGQDEFNDILTEQYGDANIKRTFGGLSANACMSMNDDYGSGGQSESDYWTTFGDPSIMVRTASPMASTVTHDAVMVIGSTECPVNTGAPNSLAALSSNGELLGYAYADASGMANIILDEPILEPGELHIVVTGYNYETYEADIFAIVPEGPYIVMDYYEVTEDSNGNGNIDYGEQVALTINAENVGVDTAAEVTATVTCDDPYITMINDYVTFGDILAGDMGMSMETVIFDIDGFTPDGYSASFNIEFNSTTDTWYGGFSITVDAYCVLGDVNVDWEINVLDVIRTVNIIIHSGNPPTELEECASDVDENGITNILDVIQMINFIVGREIGYETGSAEIMIAEDGVYVNSSIPVAGIHMKVKTDNLTMAGLNGMAYITDDNLADGYENFVVFSVDGNTLPAGKTDLFFSSNFEIESVTLVSATGNEINTSIDLVPVSYALNQNYPNPFNPVTVISFETPEDGFVELAVYDILGREIVSLTNGLLNAGYHSIEWNGLDSQGKMAPTGMYIYSLKAGDQSFSKKMMLMK